MSSHNSGEMHKSQHILVAKKLKTLTYSLANHFQYKLKVQAVRKRGSLIPFRQNLVQPTNVNQRLVKPT